MTTKQVQLLLTYLDLEYPDRGFNPGVIDGIYGKMTMAALKNFVMYFGLELLEDDAQAEALKGAVGGTVPMLPETASNQNGEDFWKTIKYFTPEEFKCKCGGKYCNGYPAKVQEKLVRLEDDVREHFGRPAHNSSGLRCEKHNAKVGGVAGSRHRLGKAVDFCVEGVSSSKLDAYVGSLRGVRYHYKIDGSYVHMDIE